MPAGVFSVLQGDRGTVEALVAHEDEAPSRSSGPPLPHEACMQSRHGTRVQALGGAKNHAVILPDADLEARPLTASSRPRSARPASAAWRSPSRWLSAMSRESLVAAMRRARCRVAGGTGRTRESVRACASTRRKFSAPSLRWCGSADARRGDSPDQLRPLRERGVNLHEGWRKRSPLRAAGRCRHGRSQCLDPGAGRLPILRGLEESRLRRPPFARSLYSL